MNKKLSAVLIILVITIPLFALDFNVAPNEDGSLDFLLELDWKYNDNWFSAIKGEYRNIVDSSEDEISFVDTSGKVLSLGADILGYEIFRRRLRFDIALNTQWENMRIREIGYIDNAETDTRFFILNDRVLNLILPRVKGEARYHTRWLTFSIGGEYSPWLWVGLDQELTINPGLDASPFESQQSATNAFSLNGNMYFRNEFLTPKGFFEYDHLAIKYSANSVGGEVEVHSLTQTLTLGGTFVLNFIKMKDIHPSITVSNVWDWTTDLSVDNAEAVVDKEFEFSFGFEF
jgi:hypothetical protein